MPYAKSISLGHRYSIVDIAFGTDNAVDFNLGDYQYKLIGYDEAWRPLPGSIIRYMNLPPGHYRLAVQSRPTKLLDGGGRIELGIRVYPPFYASIPAYILYVLLIMLITAWVVRYYYTKKQLEQSLAMERMAREQQERITQWKLVFFTNISHEFRTPLTLIQGQLDLLARQEMPGVLKGYLMSVRRNALRLRDLVNELIDFRKQEQGYMSLKVSRQDLVAYLADVCGHLRGVRPHPRGGAALRTRDGAAGSAVRLGAVAESLLQSDKQRFQTHRPGRADHGDALGGRYAGRGEGGRYGPRHRGEILHDDFRTLLPPRGRHAGRRGLASDWPFRKASSNCTAGGSASRARWEWVRPSR